MKLMMNGALTLGAYDGANVEMVAATGHDNMFIFGMNCDEVEELWKKGYNAYDRYATNQRARKAVDYLNIGFAGQSFSNIGSYLLNSQYGVADPYMCLADFDSYTQARENLLATYAKKREWNKMSLINIAASGFFAADRSINEYAQRIWGLNRLDK
ncbi:MAG: glycogen/starch/alpha-glucan phosphorylase, partial [Clostridia bacterium]|nr:glycogen/starch/alpha-glucan phosphorylase [Clostridia bacterium]